LAAARIAFPDWYDFDAPDDAESEFKKLVRTPMCLLFGNLVRAEPATILGMAYERLRSQSSLLEAAAATTASPSASTSSSAAAAAADVPTSMQLEASLRLLYVLGDSVPGK
jgi:hypothetical protein